MVPKFLDDNKILEKKVINKNLKKKFYDVYYSICW